MADQWNSNIPAMGNQISADIPDIKENLEHARDSFERIFETWSTSNGGNASAKFDSATGFSDGTYNYEFPTNGVGAHSVIMLGTSDTIVWMYLNTAPPGWKVVAGVTDVSLAVAGGSGAYNVNGGTTAGTAWSSLTDHTHAGGTLAANHNHNWLNPNTGTSSDDRTYNSGGSSITLSSRSATGGNFLNVNDTGGARLAEVAFYTDNDNTAVTGASGTAISEPRPTAAVGKLYQLDTA